MPGKDIFGYSRNRKPKAVLSNTKTLMTFAGGDNAKMIGTLIQNWNVRYNNNITELFELGSDNVYWVKGRPMGEFSIGRVIGYGSHKLLGDDAYDVCKGGTTVDIETSPDACDEAASELGQPKGVKLSLGGLIVIGIGFGAQVGTNHVNEDISCRYSSLNVGDSKVA